MKIATFASGSDVCDRAKFHYLEGNYRIIRVTDLYRNPSFAKLVLNPSPMRGYFFFVGIKKLTGALDNMLNFLTTAAACNRAQQLFHHELTLSLGHNSPSQSAPSQFYYFKN